MPLWFSKMERCSLRCCLCRRRFPSCDDSSEGHSIEINIACAPCGKLRDGCLMFASFRPSLAHKKKVRGRDCKFNARGSYNSMFILCRVATDLKRTMRCVRGSCWAFAHSPSFLEALLQRPLVFRLSAFGFGFGFCFCCSVVPLLAFVSVC